jgi:hypothetical protein
MNFWRVKIKPCFEKSFENDFFLFVKRIMHNVCIIEKSNWLFIFMNFVGYSYKISKVILPC